MSGCHSASEETKTTNYGPHFLMSVEIQQFSTSYADCKYITHKLKHLCTTKENMFARPSLVEEYLELTEIKSLINQACSFWCAETMLIDFLY